MQITWYGHSCFLLEDASGLRVLTDPCGPETGCGLETVEADVVTVSHTHQAHSHLNAVRGNPVVIRLGGEKRFQNLRVRGIPTWHDAVQGKEYGCNLMFLIEMEGLRVLHLGDIGHTLQRDILEEIGRVDVLLAPVGGGCTIDAEGARQIYDVITPSVMIPMHYRTAAAHPALNGVEVFLETAKDLNIHRLDEASCSVNADALGKARVVILDFEKQRAGV